MKKVLRLKELMNEKGISRQVLAEAMNVTPATISNISTGKVYPSIKFLLEVSDYLDVDIREMFVQTKDVSPSQSKVEEVKKMLKLSIELLN